MSEPVNLNKFRKAKTRAAKQQKAAENRVKYGRTKAEKARDRLEIERNGRSLDKKELDH